MVCRHAPLAGTHASPTSPTSPHIQGYYGETLKTSEDLKTSACKTCTPVPPLIRDLLRAVPQEVGEGGWRDEKQIRGRPCGKA